MKEIVITFIVCAFVGRCFIYWVDKKHEKR